MKFKTILLDMDGTLINNDRNRFGAEYIELVYKRFPSTIPFPKFQKAVYTAFMAMTKTTAVEPISGHSKRRFSLNRLPPAAQGIRLFDRAHQHDFSVLQRPEEKIPPEAREVVQKLFDLGLRVVIATNPIFPKDIMYERLRWAEVEDLPFDLVTSYEDSHYAKPNPPLYYREILTKIGARAEHSLMVGDEHMDMVAATIGISTFFVESPSSDLTEATPKPTHKGELKDVIRILQQ